MEPMSTCGKNGAVLASGGYGFLEVTKVDLESSDHVRRPYEAI
jgi:hypothetical protein